MWISAAIHVVAILALLFFSPLADLAVDYSLKPPREPIRIYLKPVPVAPAGGGGASDILPPSRGRAPSVAQKVFVPPAAVVVNQDPELTMAPTLVAISLPLPNVDMTQFGDPRAKPGPPSGGRGTRGGIGIEGSGGGIGPGRGPALGGPGGSSMQFTGVKSDPVLVYKTEPEFSEEARKARVQGTVVLEAEIGVDGRPRNLRVRTALGLGLDERALDAVKMWRFKPAMRNGRPLETPALIYVNFHLL